ncbi:MAG TPA: hypothetical protein DEP87_02590 [Candidatus Pacebacteria bacterium]|nr:hypothetical protein [Candidatus Paceibacterota bacterium]
MIQAALTSTTQDFLDIYDITNNMVFMKDGSAAVALQVSAMNFSLLAEEEQDAVIYAYAALLNSLNYPIQINIQSKTKDATVYLDLLKTQEDEVSSIDKKRRIARYRAFVGQLIQERNVLDKKFYVVIPAAPLELGIVPPQSFLPGATPFDITTIEKSVLLEKAAGILSPRVDHLIGQFSRIGLFARQIDTQEIIQNFYANYNPEAVEGQQITDSSDYTTSLVQASLFASSLQNRQQTMGQFSHPTSTENPGAHSINQPTPADPTNPADQTDLTSPVDLADPIDSSIPVDQTITAESAPTSPPQPVTDQLVADQPPADLPIAPPAPPTPPAPSTPPTTYSLPPLAEIT